VNQIEALTAPLILEAMELPAGTTGIDCLTLLDSHSAAALKSADAEFALQYLDRITAASRDAVLRARLALGLIAHDRGGNWTPSATLGGADGLDAVRRARALAIPKETTIWIPLEEWSGPASGAIGYVNAAASVIQTADFRAGLYVGFAEHPLTPEQLWELLVTLYWHSCSIVPDVARCNYCMKQTKPNTWLAGVLVDHNEIMSDLLGRLPTFVVAKQ